MTRKKPLVGGQFNSPANQAIRRLWGDVEVVDADQNLRVFIQPEDVKGAVAKDPGACVFARACMRQFKASKVMFFKSVAYVELPGPKGKRRVERFMMSPQMRDLVENFDRGNPVPEVCGFELAKPRPSKTLEGERRRNRKHGRNALISGAVQSSPTATGRGKGAYERPPLVVDLSVRNGSGRVHFRKKG